MRGPSSLRSQLFANGYRTIERAEMRSYFGIPVDVLLAEIVDAKTKVVVGRDVSFSGGKSWVFENTFGTSGQDCPIPVDPLGTLARMVFYPEPQRR